MLEDFSYNNTLLAIFNSIYPAGSKYALEDLFWFSIEASDCRRVHTRAIKVKSPFYPNRYFLSGGNVHIREITELEFKSLKFVDKIGRVSNIEYDSANHIVRGTRLNYEVFENIENLTEYVRFITVLDSIYYGYMAERLLSDE